MTFKTPTVEEFQELARQLSLSINDDEARRMSGYMEPFVNGYSTLEKLNNKFILTGDLKRKFKFPEDQENKYNAWHVNTSIKNTDKGPLSGHTIAIKDNIFVKDIPMANGSSILGDFIPEYDATVITRVLDAGAEIKGKSVCEFFCLSGGSGTAITGVVRNPRNPDYSTGGSSSGSSALVVSGDVDMALGTDQGGSIRIPASWSGAYGMKATHGLVPYTGAAPMETSIDYIGPITNNVRDNALLLEVLAGYHSSAEWDLEIDENKYTNALSGSVEGLKIALVKEGFNHPLSESDVDKCVSEAAQQFTALGATVDEVSIPLHLDGVAIWGAIVSDGWWQTVKLNGLGYNYDGMYSLAYHHAMEGFTQKINETPVNAQLLMLLGKHLERFHGRYYAMAKNMGHKLRLAYDQAFNEYDLLLMPTTVQKSSKNPEPQNENATDIIMAQAFNNTLNTCQFNVTGHPAISIPCGMREGLPVGLMLVGKHYDEATIYRAAYHFEQSAHWEQR
jgi:amidase